MFVFQSLRTKFIAFIILPVSVGLIGLSVLSYLTAQHLLYAQMRQSGFNYLRAIEAEISTTIVKLKAVLNVIDLSQSFQPGNVAALRLTFVKIHHTMGEAVTSVYAGFADGRMVRSKTAKLPAGYDPRWRTWYTDAVNLPSGRPDGLTAPYLDASTNHPTITLYRKILDDNNRLMGVLAMDLDVARSSQYLTGKAEHLPESQIMLVNSDAVILLDRDPAVIGHEIGYDQKLLNQEIVAAIKNPAIEANQWIKKHERNLWYIGFSRMDVMDVCVVVIAPAKQVLEPLFQLAFKIAGVTLPLIIILLILLLIMNRKISVPIINLKNSALRVTEQDAYQQPLEIKSGDEVGQLTRAFNLMMDGLRQRDFIKDTFGRYVTREVVEELLENPDGLKLGGEKREVTILFSDLRGFTPLCEQLAPDQVMSMLNRYLGRMVSVINIYKGTVNEFIGDAILVFFGAPVNHDDNVARAAACALAMQMAMAEINRENASLDLPPLAMGIGINTGEVIVGNIGSLQRAKYGVVGHAINVASRVQGVAAGGQVLITQSAFDYIKEIAVTRDRRYLNFKGVEEDMAIYDLRGMKGGYHLSLPDETR